jgi:hypothetical protein
MNHDGGGDREEGEEGKGDQEGELGEKCIDEGRHMEIRGNSRSLHSISSSIHILE